MASGFLEPLDAPGHSQTLDSLETLAGLLDQLAAHGAHSEVYDAQLASANSEAREDFDTWCSFILCQYRTCHRSDTPFWRDHKAVRFPFHDELMAALFQPHNTVEDLSRIIREPNMFLTTVAGKGIRWSLADTQLPDSQAATLVLTMDHYEMMQELRARLR